MVAIKRSYPLSYKYNAGKSSFSPLPASKQAGSLNVGKSLYGLNIQCFPDEYAVELVERQIARQRQRREEEG